MKTRKIFICLFSALVALTAASCNKKNLKKGGAAAPEMITDTSLNPVLEIMESSDTASTEGNIRGGEFSSAPSIEIVYFDFDKHGLSENTRATLQRNAEALKAHRDWTVLVEGYCDSRGTVEYNLALGQKRAKEVRDYYARLGVPEASMGTISYGKEKPSCVEETEACWSENRKAETKVKLK